MNKGFLSPKIAKKTATTPRVDVDELAALLGLRLKNDEVENAEGAQFGQVTRGVTPHSVTRLEDNADHGTTVGSESTQINVIDSQVKPVLLVNATSDSNGGIGVEVENSGGIGSQGADLEINVNNNNGVQPSVIENQPNVEQLIAKANKNFDDAMNKLDRDIANMASSSSSLGGATGNKVTSTTTSFSEAMKSQQFPSVEEVFKASSDKVPNVGSSKGEGSISSDNISGPTSFANVVNPEKVTRKVNFRSLVNEERIENHDTFLPKAAMEGVLNRYDNTLVGFFIGKNIAFPLVQNYVTNTWGKFGFKNVMKNDDGVFLFKFESKEGVDNVMQRGPWIIRSSPLILTKWTPDVLLAKSDVTKLPVWIKLHNVPLLAYSEDGLSLIATQVGTPIMLDAFTSSMCFDSWGRISYARALVEISSESELKHEVTMAIPKKDDSGIISTCIKVEYEWKPPHCSKCKVFGHDHNGCPKNVKELVRTKDASVAPNTTLEETNDGFKEVQNRKAKGKGKKLSSGINMSKGPTIATKKQVYVVKNKTQEAASSKVANASGSSVTTSNPFGVLEVQDSDVNVIPSASKGTPSDVVDLVSPSVCNTDGAKVDSHSRGASSGITSGKAELERSSGSTKVADKVESHSRGSYMPSSSSTPSVATTKSNNPFSKVGDVVCSDSDDDEVLEPETGYLASGGGGYDLEDIVPDDYAAQVYDLPGHLAEFCDMYDINLLGRGRK